jgi:uncharacterized protein YbgA (DUF1722 family)
VLGKLVADPKKWKKEKMLQEYLANLMKGLQCNASSKKNRNVLQHVMGYFKDVLSADEKKELEEVITHYGQGLIPLIVPITLLRHYVRKYKQPYLQMQHYLHPHPLELMLRNHV